MGKTVFFEVEEWEEEFLQKTYGDSAQLVHEVITKENASQYQDAEIISTFIYSTLTKEAIDLLPQLKLIATRSTGFDHIDTLYCQQKGIAVCTVPSYGVHTVAEHTFGLILALTKKLIPSIERTRKGDFSLDGLEGIDINGKTLGVIGTGKIGTAVIHIAQAFGMHVIAMSRHLQTSESPLLEFVTDLSQVLLRADIVTLHMPLTPETKHIINLQNIQQLKKGAYLINTARGGLIETQAILEGLEKGILAGVGLDVLEDECDIREERELLSSEFLKSCDLKTQLMQHMLLNRDDVLITPHKAFDTKEAIQEILEITVANIKAFQNGSPQNVVDSLAYSR